MSNINKYGVLSQFTKSVTADSWKKIMSIELGTKSHEPKFCGKEAAIFRNLF